jgi:phage tail sheath gpL-like
MSAAKFTIVVTGNDDEIPVDSTPESLQKIGTFIESCRGGCRLGNVTFEVRNNAVAATGTVTCASASAADTVTINGTAFTAVSGTPAGNQFKVGVSDTADAASLVSAINASATAIVSNHVTASSALGVVTLTAKVPGHVGNAITLASSNGTRLAVSGARLTGGTHDTLITHTV